MAKFEGEGENEGAVGLKRLGAALFLVSKDLGCGNRIEGMEGRGRTRSRNNCSWGLKARFHPSLLASR